MFNSFQERQPNTDNIISAKLKLNEFFLTYLSQTETTQYIHDLLNGLNNSTPNSTPTKLPTSPSTSPYKAHPSDEPVVFSLGEPTTPNDNIQEIDSLQNLQPDFTKSLNKEIVNNEEQKIRIEEPQHQAELLTQEKIEQNFVDETNKQTNEQDNVKVVEPKEQEKRQEQKIESVVMEQPQQPKPKVETIENEQDKIMVDTINTTNNTVNSNECTPPPQKIEQQQPTIKIPQFYFPNNKKITTSPNVNNDSFEFGLSTIKHNFELFKGQPESVDPITNNVINNNTNNCTTTTHYITSFDEFETIIKELYTFPRILNRLLFIYTLRTLRLNDICITEDKFVEFWKNHIYGKEPEELLFNILRKSEDSKYLYYEDFFLFSKTLIDFHPGLEFLSNTPEFQDRYQETIIIRIFYGTCRNKGRITVKDLKSNNFIRSLSLLDAEPDINKHLEYFSYEHFYVIYCKFWELDIDHDLFIDANDLAKYGSCSLTPLIIDRIIINAIFTKTLFGVKNKLSYQDFVWFILSEEDKTSETSIEFWFSCVDIDSDGFLSLYEMDTFYKEQKQRLDYLNLDPPVFKDLLCQILDMVKPDAIEKITLLDLKSSKMAGYLFNILFNINKFLQQESKESITCDQPMSDWNRFALQEYERALAEESLSYQEDDEDDDEEDDDDEDDRRMHIE
ncbi:hypothetical protein DICPUDRAFT_95777 [Dictyostelium purpureum]|uniref:EF-hand domain-containing protein n=1 Tax=Dictyostelium purpureum TaxID=5786 RepID=F1A0L9_DICPU|nr:uncharacterized protein DICPUDRAFT_95777 [Dictyostelium purpureum]EGC30259.1 hypothetical protein DICPUDRAFT_95777 [Dictyostelium purpureum]|eukprot:XP_003293211.1 hypothetical protein DICPUDRAFT_95777 [Dictyostelium purpureum]